jgi:hypothetical protein
LSCIFTHSMRDCTEEEGENMPISFPTVHVRFASMHLRKERKKDT